jgi:hypothetical protein
VLFDSKKFLLDARVASNGVESSAITNRGKCSRGKVDCDLKMETRIIVMRLMRTSSFESSCFLLAGVWHAVVLFYGAYLATEHGNSYFSNGKVVTASCRFFQNLLIRIACMS